MRKRPLLRLNITTIWTMTRAKMLLPIDRPLLNTPVYSRAGQVSVQTNRIHAELYRVAQKSKPLPNDQKIVL